MQYKLNTNTTVTSNGASSLKATRKGVIVALCFSMQGTGGAGTGRIEYEVSKQNASNLSTNDAPGAVVLGSASIAYPNGNTAAENVTTACNVPVEAGDNLYINTVAAGTGATTANCNVYLIMREV